MGSLEDPTHVLRTWGCKNRKCNVSNASYNEHHWKPLFMKENIMSVICLELILYAKDNLHEFKFHRDIHLHQSRNIKRFVVPKCRLTKTMNNYEVTAIKVSNKFPAHIFCYNRTTLKRQLSGWLITTARNFRCCTIYFFSYYNDWISLSCK